MPKSRVVWDDGERRSFCLAMALLEEKERLLGKPIPFMKMCDQAQKDAILGYRRRPRTSFQKQAMPWLTEYMVQARTTLQMRGVVTPVPQVESQKPTPEEKAQESGMTLLERVEARLMAIGSRLGAVETVILDVFTSQSAQQAADPHVAQAVHTLKQHHRRIALIGLVGDKEAAIRKEYTDLLKLTFLHSKKGHVSVNSVGKVEHVFSIRGLNREAQHAVETETGQKIQFFDDEQSLRRALNHISVRAQ